MKKHRLMYKIYKQRREEFIAGEKKDKQNLCYWTWQALKQLHLEHIWESENFERGRNFDNLVRKLIKRKDEDEWREEMKKKRKLRLYSRIKTRLQLEDYVVELDREKRRRQLTMIIDKRRNKLFENRDRKVGGGARA